MPIRDIVARRAYDLAWRNKRRAEWFKGKKCVGCGSRRRLELDHLDPEQKVTHRVWSWAKERREKELAKCVARCYRCHMKRTAAQHKARWPRVVTHGTISGYLNHACRCEVCKAFYKQWRRDKYERIGK